MKKQQNQDNKILGFLFAKKRCVLQFCSCKRYLLRVCKLAVLSILFLRKGLLYLIHKLIGRG